MAVASRHTAKSHVAANDPVNDPVTKSNDPIFEETLNERQQWILSQLGQDVQLRIGMVVAHFGCSSKTAKRDLANIKSNGWIDFVGSPKMGYYRLTRRSSYRLPRKPR